VEDALFETVVLFFICLDGDGSVGFTIGNGLKLSPALGQHVELAPM
jgi:hypothetical protein